MLNTFQVNLHLKNFTLFLAIIPNLHFHSLHCLFPLSFSSPELFLTSTLTFVIVYFHSHFLHQNFSQLPLSLSGLFTSTQIFFTRTFLNFHPHFLHGLLPLSLSSPFLTFALSNFIVYFHSHFLHHS